MKNSINKPLLMILMKGKPGVGKSAIADAIGRMLKIPVIDKDDFRDILDRDCLTPKRARELSYRAMFKIARRQLALSQSVICDSPLRPSKWFNEALKIAKHYNARLLVINCFCSSLKVWENRLKFGGRSDLPAHRIRRWWELKQGPLQERWWRVPKEVSIDIDTVESLEKNAKLIIQTLNNNMVFPRQSKTLFSKSNPSRGKKWHRETRS